MSRETLEWLNVMTLIGCTVSRASQRSADGWHQRQRELVTADAGVVEGVAAWSYRATMQGDEPNHYAEFIPVDDVRRRLFNWSPVRGDVKSTGTLMTPDGVHTFTIVDEERVHILRPPGSLSEDDPGAILGTFKVGYKVHEFVTWLLENVALLLDDTLGISAAGLLGQGARAWVEVSTPDTIVTPEGVEFRPNLLAATSLDGSIATGYGFTSQMSICDNTLAIARREKGRKLKFRHTTNSLSRLLEARDELGIQIATAGGDFAAEVAELTNVTVTESEWEQFLAETHPTKDEKGEEKTGRSRTYALNRRDELQTLYTTDPRCTPWSGTAFGVLQTVNTHAHHVGTVKNMSRPQRNMERAVSGEIATLDATTLRTLAAVGVEV